jgi:ASC-1-like (ASCH) protein
MMKEKSMKNKIKMNNNPSTYIEHVSEPWFSLINLGLKIVEGRKNKGRFHDMKVGDIIEWKNEDFMSRSVKTKITKKVVYSTFKEYLETEGLDNCLPGMPSIEHGLSVYYKYYTKEDEKEYGVMAIHIQLLNYKSKEIKITSNNQLKELCKKKNVFLATIK